MKRLMILMIFVITGCSPKIKSSFSNSQPELTTEDPVAFLDLEHELPEDVLKVGELTFQDSGLSTDCSFNSILNRARKSARKHGANVVKIVEKKEPNLWSTCYRLHIKLYKFEGDVSGLPQYELTLD